MSRARAGRRYRLGSVTGRAGRADRYAATDDRLGREVQAWCVEAPDGDDDRELLLTLARSLASAPDPALLRVLDIVPEADRLTVVLESPSAGRSSAAAREVSPQELAQAGATMARAFRLTASRGLEPERLAWRDVTWDAAGSVRLDPIAVYYLDQTEPEPPPAAQLVADLLAERVRADRVRAGGASSDPAPGELRQLLARWQRGDGADLAALEAELTALGGGTTLEELPDLPPTGLPDIELEPTLPFEQTPVPEPALPRSPSVAAAEAPVTPSARLAEGAAPEDAIDQAGLPEAGPYEAGRLPRRVSRTATGDRVRDQLRRARWAVIVPLAAAVLVVALGSLAVATGRGPGADEAARPSGGPNAGPPVEQPAPGRVTVGLQAQERSSVRVMVDGVVEFDGTLNTGQRQSWEGAEAIQVWTDKGKTLLLAVNGQNLGPYSPAMGHPDWNRIEFTFWPGSP